MAGGRPPSISDILEEEAPWLLPLLEKAGESVWYEGDFYALLTVLETKMEYYEKRGFKEEAEAIHKQILFYEEVFSQKLAQLYREHYGKEVVPYYDFNVDRFRDAITGQFLKPPHKIAMEEVSPYYLYKDWKLQLSDLDFEIA